jgi:hypothetical protein
MKGEKEGKEQKDEMKKELILLVKKKKGGRGEEKRWKKCEDLSSSCGDNPLLCTDQVCSIN